MKLALHVPSPPLDAHVEAIWVVRGLAPHRRERVLPNGAIELIFNLGSPHAVVRGPGSTLHREAWLAGLQQGPLVIEAVRETDLVGVRFRPGGLVPFVRVPAHELTNDVIDHDAVLGRDLAPLRERLLAARTDGERVRLLEQALRARLRSSDPARRVEPWLAHVLAGLSDPERPASIGALAREVGVSHKHLIDRFRRAVGTTPKHLARILRLQAVIAATRGVARVEWAAVAARCGYYDQPHLVRDWKRLTGATPGEYLAARDDDANHMRGG